jgi:GYF domain 2
MSESNWYYTQSDQRMGPVPLEQLQSLITQGQVNPHDLAWTDGMEQWARVDHLPVLRSAVQSSAPVSATVSPVIPVAARVEYASRVVTLPPRAQTALRGHASPTGDIGDWPLDDLRVGQFERAVALRRKVTAAASLYRLLMFLSGISGGILLIVALVQLAGPPRARSEALGFLIFTIVSLGFTTLYFFVWRGTMRSQRWAPLTMFVLFLLGFLVNLIVTFGMMAQASPGAIGAVFGLIIYGAFAAVSWRSFAAIPIYLAQPAWCQEMLVKAKL